MLVYLQAGAGRIELFTFAEEGRRAASDRNEDLGFEHVAFQVDDVDAVAARLRARDVEFPVEPLDAAGNVPLAFFRDPDGNPLELVNRLPDMDTYRGKNA
jgi:catechol 2,3-dioxygenase-like lactoylglutathione lyase family enzyme